MKKELDGNIVDIDLENVRCELKDLGFYSFPKEYFSYDKIHLNYNFKIYFENNQLLFEDKTPIPETEENFIDLLYIKEQMERL